MKWTDLHPSPLHPLISNTSPLHPPQLINMRNEVISLKSSVGFRLRNYSKSTKFIMFVPLIVF